MSTKEDKELIRFHLQELADKNGGRLTPAMVVEDAKSEDSPLHEMFEWDTAKAAANHWLDQARSIIRSVNVVIRTEHTVVTAPYFVRDPSANAAEQGYIAVKTVRSDTDVAREVLVQEFTRAADMLRRAQQVARALEMEADVEALVRGVVGLRERVAAEANA